MNLPTEEECVCCRDIRGKLNKLEQVDEPMPCITGHPTFIDMCEMYRRFGPTRTPPLDNRSLRKAAYRMFTLWDHKYLGPNHYSTIPACAVRKVREMFPKEIQIPRVQTSHGL